MYTDKNMTARSDLGSKQRTERPEAASILSFVGGTLITLFLGWSIVLFAVSFGGRGAGVDLLYPSLGPVMGAGIILSAIMLYRRAARHEAYGAIILVLSIIGPTTFYTGLVGSADFGSVVFGVGYIWIGTLLGFVGGILGIGWHPRQVQTVLLGTCSTCGAIIQPWTRFCSQCGKPLA